MAADNTRRVAGTCYLSIDGKRVALAGEFAYQVSGVQRDSVVGQDGPHGYKEKPMLGNITGKLRDTGGLSLVDLSNLTNVPAVAELANGKVVKARNAFWSGEPPKADAEDAQIDFKLESADVTDAN